MPAQPLNVPVIQKPTPIVLDELLVETTDSNKALYDRMLEKGHFHPDQQKYPGYRFLKSEPTQYGQVRYFWANDFSAQDSYNAEKSYAAEGNAYPTFIRSYRVLRAEYLVTGPSTKGVAFKGIASVAITNGGSNYTEDFAVTFSGGAGSGAAAMAIVDKGAGKVLRIELNNVGDGYTSAPTVSFSAGAGTGAAATAVIQPTTCVLVAEKHSKLPDDDPYTSLYDKVTRTWMTLPGPILSGDELHDDTGQSTPVTRQIVAATTSGSGGVDGAGTYSIIEPQTTVISEKITRATVSAHQTQGQSWTEGRHVSLPRVLQLFTPISFDDTDGNTIFAGMWNYLADYSGGYVITVYELWQDTPHTVSITNLRPQSFEFITPLGSGGVREECLHDQIEITGNTASDGSTPAGNGRFYAYIAWDFIFPATTPASLSGDIVLVDEQRRFAGGFLRHRETITI